MLCFDFRLASIMSKQPAGLGNSKGSPLIKVRKPVGGYPPTEPAETTSRLHWKKGAWLGCSFREKSDLDYPVQRFLSFLSFGSQGAAG